MESFDTITLTFSRRITEWIVKNRPSYIPKIDVRKDVIPLEYQEIIFPDINQVKGIHTWFGFDNSAPGSRLNETQINKIDSIINFLMVNKIDTIYTMVKMGDQYQLSLYMPKIVDMLQFRLSI